MVPVMDALFPECGLSGAARSSLTQSENFGTMPLSLSSIHSNNKTSKMVAGNETQLVSPNNPVSGAARSSKSTSFLGGDLGFYKSTVQLQGEVAQLKEKLREQRRLLKRVENDLEEYGMTGQSQHWDLLRKKLGAMFGQQQDGGNREDDYEGDTWDSILKIVSKCETDIDGAADRLKENFLNLSLTVKDLRGLEQ